MERETMTDELHPGPIELEQYARGRLSPGHAAVILAHAASCPSCGRVLARLADEESYRRRRGARARVESA